MCTIDTARCATHHVSDGAKRSARMAILSTISSLIARSDSGRNARSSCTGHE